MGDTSEEATPQQETGLCKYSQLCVGHTSGKLPDNVASGVTVLVAQSITHILPSGLQKVCDSCYEGIQVLHVMCMTSVYV